ncbi:MAG: hypothetical protein ACXVHR_08735 [Methanobacterium sp.]
MTQNFDMSEMWKNYYNQSSTLIDEKMKEQIPPQVIGQLLEMYLLYHKLLNETTERYLEQMNVPTRKDISKIFSLIINVDTKVDDLETLLEEAGSKQLNPAELQFKIENFEKKLESVDAKLNQILTQVNYLIEVNTKKAADTNEAAKVNAAANKKEVTKITAAAKNRRTVKNKVATNNKRAVSNKDD